MELHKLANRSNVHHFYIKNGGSQKDLILYDDHRTLLNVLFEYRRKSKNTPNLIYFDQHDDAVVPWALTIQERQSIFEGKRIEDISEREFWAYSEFDLSILDDDWLTTAMDFNLIKDAVCIGVIKDNNVAAINQRYVNQEPSHELFTMGHLDWEVGNRGKLGDTFIENEENLYLRKLFQYNADDEYCETEFILDFDLDCFATDCMDKVIAWPREIFFNKYVKNNDAYELMKSLIRRASLITICREPECCGGLGESNKILSYLDDYFFEGSLHTRPIE